MTYCPPGAVPQVVTASQTTDLSNSAMWPHPREVKNQTSLPTFQISKHSTVPSGTHA